MSLPLFLLHCVRAFLAPEAATPLRAPGAEEVDWPALLRLASWHRVVPFLYWGLQRTCPEAVPPSARTELEGQMRAALGHSLLLTGELLRLLQDLHAQGIPALPFKGPALAATLHGDVALRQCDDLDLLVQQADFPQAKRRLLALGYQPQYVLTERQAQASLGRGHAEAFMRGSDAARVVVDLHWRIRSRVSPLHLDLDGLWARRVPVSLAGTTVATLAPEDVLLVICAHGSHHHWSRLQWICDVARLVRVRPTLDWSRITEQARTARSQRMLWLGLCLAQDLLAAPLPPEVAPQVQHHPPTTRLARQVRRHLLEGALDQPPHWQRILFRVHLMVRGPDRLRYVVRALTSPNRQKWLRVPLPDPLFPVYYALRPLRLAGKYGLRAAQYLFTRGQGR